METNRLEAFSDGVLAIIITIMVLELKVPHEPTISALSALWPVLLSYLLSYLYVGIYWNNHHHLLKATRQVTGGIMWANLHLLFWLSLFPFVTGWMGENHFASLPTVAYGAVLFMAGVAYRILQGLIIADQGSDSALAKSLGADWKGIFAPLAYLLGTGAAFLSPMVAGLIYAAVAVSWLVPDPRLARVIHQAGAESDPPLA